jgi:hypothetical protein
MSQRFQEKINGIQNAGKDDIGVLKCFRTCALLPQDTNAQCGLFDHESIIVSIPQGRGPSGPDLPNEFGLGFPRVFPREQYPFGLRLPQHFLRILSGIRGDDVYSASLGKQIDSVFRFWVDATVHSQGSIEIEDDVFNGHGFSPWSLDSYHPLSPVPHELSDSDIARNHHKESLFSQTD